MDTAIPPRQTAYVGVGGNQGDVRAALTSAVHALGALPFTAVLAVSSLYRTRPVEADGPDYLNAVVALRSALGPRELLCSLLAIEQQHDRQRPYRHAPRTLDLDLLWYGGASRDTPALILPHPRMAQRAFVLEPLSQLLDAAPSRALALPDARTRKMLAEAQGIEHLGPWFSV